MTYIFLQFYYIFMFEARYLMEWLLLHVLFSHMCHTFLYKLNSPLCYLDISFFLNIILLSQFQVVARKIAVTLRQISFSVCQRVVIV